MDFSIYGSDAIPAPTDYDSTKIFHITEIAFLKEINRFYGQYSAWKLKELTLSELPWLNTARNAEISHYHMKNYFKTQLHS